MTREEALEALKYSIGILPVTDRAVSALGMAIKALSQQTEDVISREAALEVIAETDITNGTEPVFTGKQVQALLRDLPTVTPKQRTGHWIIVQGMNEQCSNCKKFFPLLDFKCRPFEINYCPNCGAKMVESQESEGTDADSN